MFGPLITLAGARSPVDPGGNTRIELNVPTNIVPAESTARPKLALVSWVLGPAIRATGVVLPLVPAANLRTCGSPAGPPFWLET